MKDVTTKKDLVQIEAEEVSLSDFAKGGSSGLLIDTTFTISDVYNWTECESRVLTMAVRQSRVSVAGPDLGYVELGGDDFDAGALGVVVDGGRRSDSGPRIMIVGDRQKRWAGRFRFYVSLADDVRIRVYDTSLVTLKDVPMDCSAFFWNEGNIQTHSSDVRHLEP